MLLAQKDSSTAADCQENWLHQTPTSNTVFASGPEFLSDLTDEIDRASEYVLVNMFLWRNDVSGRLIGEKLLEAADRGVKIYIAKDRIGALFEYSERDGQSFFHDTPMQESLWDTHSVRSIIPQSMLMALFYGNRPSLQQANPLAEALRKHPNVTVLDKSKLYNHSKVVAIDGETAYIGGVGFGDEFCSDSEKTWLDFMLKIQSATDVQNLLRVIVGEQMPSGSSLKFNSDALCAESDTYSLYEDLLRFIRETRESLTVVMPFLGSVPCIKALADVVRNGCPVRLITSEEAPSNRYRNPHFLKRLIRECHTSVHRLTITLTKNITHGKLLLRDGRIRLGSQNMVLGSQNIKRVVDETVVETEEPETVAQFRDSLEAQLDASGFTDFPGTFEDFSNLYPWRRVIVGSRCEWAGAMLQHRMSHARKSEVSRARQEVNTLIRELIL